MSQYKRNLDKVVYHICIDGLNQRLSIDDIQKKIDSNKFNLSNDNDLASLLADAEHDLALTIEERRNSFLRIFNKYFKDEGIEFLKKNVEMIKKLFSDKHNLVKISQTDVNVPLYSYNGSYVGVGVKEGNIETDENAQGNIETDENGLFKIKTDEGFELYEQNELYKKNIKITPPKSDKKKYDDDDAEKNDYIPPYGQNLLYDLRGRGGKIIKRKTIKKKTIKKKKTKRKVVKKG